MRRLSSASSYVGMAMAGACALWSPAVSAQATGPVEARPAPPDAALPVDQAGSAAAADVPQESEGVQDIIVTAQKRAQNVQDVPIAVTAVLGTQLAASGVINVENLKTALAGVNMKMTGSNVQPSIRGIGTSTNNVENVVALYIDGVYYANQTDSRRDLVDIEQLAALKGPQGTLFGRNATAGVIQITTRAPSRTFSGELTTSIDNYLTSRSSVYVTGPLTDTLAYSLSGYFATQGNGWGKNLTTGRDTFKIHHNASVRGKLLFQPSLLTDIMLIGDYTDRRDNVGAYLQAFPGTRLDPRAPYIRPPGVHDSYNNDDALNIYRGGGASMTVSHDLDFARVQSITAYRQFRTGYRQDADMTNILIYRYDNTNNKARSFSQEIQLLSPTADGKLNWAAGVFYFHYRNSLLPAARSYGGPIFAPLPTSYLQRDIFSTETVNAFAPFAQADYELLPETRLTLGARWSYERRSLDGVTSGTQVNGNYVPNIIPPIRDDSITARRPTWRVALDHRYSEEVLGYVSYNRGFKSGGYNLANITNPAYQPESLDAYETGLKTRLFDRKLQINVAGFYYSYQNVQVLQAVGGSSVITNGARGEIYGLDVDFDSQLTRELRISGGIELLHAEFTRYPGALFSFSLPAGGIGTRLGDATGNRLPLSQRFTGNVSLDYARDIPIGRVTFNATVNHNGDYKFEADNVIGQKAYTLINLAATLTPGGGNLTIGLFLRNALDEDVISYANASAPLGYTATYDNPPRTFGGSAKIRF